MLRLSGVTVGFRVDSEGSDLALCLAFGGHRARVSTDARLGFGFGDPYQVPWYTSQDGHIDALQLFS